MVGSVDLDQAHLEEASMWFALSLSDAVTDAELEALDVWLAADIQNQRVFDRVAYVSRQVQRMPALGDLVPLEGSSVSGAEDRRADSGAAVATRLVDDRPDISMSPSNDWRAVTSSSGSQPRRWASNRAARWSAAGALAASLVMAIGTIGFGNAPVGTPVTTAIAQTRVLELADGSRVTLGPASQIATNVTASSRDVTLLSGEAFFEVAHDPSRPFWVTAGDTRVQVVGTKFDVNRSGQRVVVSVLQGVVKVHEPAPFYTTAKVRTLRATEMLESPDKAPLFVAAPSSNIVNDPVPAGDWRNGRLTYIDARLADVINDLNRYYRPGIQLADPSLADVRIAMGLRPSEMQSFVEGLPLIAPVKVQKNSDGKVVVQRAP